ncbi:MAG: T9SS type A sorting domain-containing protein, partial [Leeuwenhoekiella sp.]
DKKGVFLHFKTFETENDNFMDANTNGRERKLYYRELIARFGHHLALNWNIGEENTLPEEVLRSVADYIKSTDPYKHNIVFHTYPSQQSKYEAFLGGNGEVTGASIQSNVDRIHNDVKKWVKKSKEAGTKWIVANDEQGSARIGVNSDPNDAKLIRQNVLWSTLLAGGMGVEYYYGYDTGETDLNAQNHRSRDQKYTEANYALLFFNTYLQDYLPDMISVDSITAASNDFAYGKIDELYVIYRPQGGSTSINLSVGDWSVQWYNPRTGGDLTNKSSITDVLLAPDDNDWVALVKEKSSSVEGDIETSEETNCEQTIIPTDDAYLQVGARHNNNDLRVDSNSRISYLKYDLSSLTEEFDNVTLELQVSSDEGNGALEIYKGSGNDWTENNLSEENKPVAEGLIGKIDTIYSIGEKYNVELEDIVLGEVFTIIIKQITGNDLAFSSKEGDSPPKLVLTSYCADDGGEGDDENPDNTQSCIALEENGVVAVEAEHFFNQSLTSKREWFVINANTNSTPEPDPDGNHSAGASNEQYIEILPDTRVTHDDPNISGVSFENNPGKVAVVDYRVKFNNPGKYYVWVRAHSTGTEDNGVHVGLDGTWPASGERMQWCSNKNKWRWESRQRTEANDCGEEKKIFLNIPTAGEHTISFSMREDGFEMDKFILSKEFTRPTEKGVGEVLVDCKHLSLIENKFEAKNIIRLFPNPAENTISFDGVTDGSISIYDNIGRKFIANVNVRDLKNRSIDISSLSHGLYFIEFENKGVYKFIKK